MTVKIENMQHNPGDGVATFDAVFNSGWVIRRCVVIRRPDGNLAAVPPLVRSVRSVTIPDKLWFPFINAALDAYEDFKDEPQDAGLRRVLGVGERESLDEAGLIAPLNNPHH